MTRRWGVQPPLTELRPGLSGQDMRIPRRPELRPYCWLTTSVPVPVEPVLQV